MIDLSNEIRLCKNGAADNPYQGADKKVLFVCSMGILRSATGARMYAGKYNTRSAGTFEEALIPLTLMLIEWADEIVFVNIKNFCQAFDKYGKERLENKSIILDIPDTYPHMHPELKAAFEEQYEKV